MVVITCIWHKIIKHGLSCISNIFLQNINYWQLWNFTISKDYNKQFAVNWMKFPILTFGECYSANTPSLIWRTLNFTTVTPCLFGCSSQNVASAFALWEDVPCEYCTSQCLQTSLLLLLWFLLPQEVTV